MSNNFPEAHRSTSFCKWMMKDQAACCLAYVLHCSLEVSYLLRRLFTGGCVPLRSGNQASKPEPTLNQPKLTLNQP